MKIYVTRHGQPKAASAKDFVDGDNRFPKNDVPLTEIGWKQAHTLGRHLKELGFHGKIYASPYCRTMQTATAIAEELGLHFTVLTGIREIYRKWTPDFEFVGMRDTQLREYFPLCECPDLPYPWRSEEVETQEDVNARVAQTLEEVLGDRTGEDVLFVTHGAPAYASRLHLHLDKLCEPKGDWNCGLCMLDTESGDYYAFDTSFMPRELITNNALTLDMAIAQGGIKRIECQ